jgi:diaminopimelate epimerase
MHGAGNDFVLIDNRSGQLHLRPEQVSRLCDRHRGIGADGVLMVRPDPSGQADWAWDFFNSDGSRAEMCGNGARCFARFVQRLTGAGPQISILTGAGVVRTWCNGDRVTVTLTPPKDLRLDQTVRLASGPVRVHCVDTGVPHAVLFVPEAEAALVPTVGAELRWHPHFAPRGTNVDFVQVLGPNAIRVRTYERGVEAETLACGTGVTASALVAARLHGLEPPVQVRVQSGDVLEVNFRWVNDTFTDVTLTGPAEFVFEGKIEI